MNISVETCDPNSRSQDPNSPGLQPLQVPPGKYSFIHKVVDGITIIVNTVNVKFLSPAFTSSVQVSCSLLNDFRGNSHLACGVDVSNPRGVKNS